MISLVLAALVFTAHQGSAVRVNLPDERGVKSVQVAWRETTVPAFHTGNMCTTILGIDLDTSPGQHKTEALLTMEDGRVERREVTIDIAAKHFPTTQLKVEERYVEPKKADLDRANRESRETEAIYGPITTDVITDEPSTVPIPGASGRHLGQRRILTGQPARPHAGPDPR